MAFDYVVLRRSAAIARPLTRLGKSPADKAAEFELLGAAAAEGMAAQEAFSLSAERLSTADVADLSRDDIVAGLALDMPVALIQPMASDVGGAAATSQVAGATVSGAGWGISAVGAAQSQLSGKGVTVAVLDTGFDATHPAFSGVPRLTRDFTGTGPVDSANDDNGHGTHCAGIIFGRDTDGVRIGVARGIKMAYIGKVLDRYGHGTTTALARGIEWAIAQRANVISMSISFDYSAKVEEYIATGLPAAKAASKSLRAYRDNLRLFDTLVSYAHAFGSRDAGAVFIAAAGNESSLDSKPAVEIEVGLPAASTGVISVAAVGRSNGKFAAAPFSNINPTLCAPGVDIVSAWPRAGLVLKSGTSMAGPHVAGAAALWWEFLAQQGRANGANVAAQLTAMTRTKDFAPNFTMANFGAGLVQVPAT